MLLTSQACGHAQSSCAKVLVEQWLAQGCPYHPSQCDLYSNSLKDKFHFSRFLIYKLSM